MVGSIPVFSFAMELIAAFILIRSDFRAVYSSSVAPRKLFSVIVQFLDQCLIKSLFHESLTILKTDQVIALIRIVLSAGLTDDFPATAIKEFTKSFFS